MKTQRLVVLVTAEQKRALARRAKALDVSVGELLRRSSEGADARDLSALSALANELRASARESRAALRSALSEAEETLAQLGRRRGRQRVA
jgi:hypothetical protein